MIANTSEATILDDLRFVFRESLGIDPVTPIEPGDAVFRRPGAGVDRRGRARRGDPAPPRSAAFRSINSGRTGRATRRDM